MRCVVHGWMPATEPTLQKTNTKGKNLGNLDSLGLLWEPVVPWEPIDPSPKCAAPVPPRRDSVSPKGPAAHGSARGAPFCKAHGEDTHSPLAGGHAHPCSRVAVLLAAPGVLRAQRPSPGSGEAAAERTHGSASAIRLCAAPLIATQLAALQHTPRGDPVCQQEGFPPSTAPVATSKPPNLSWFGAPRHRGGYRMAQGTAGQTCRA